jgi:type VI secretion system Hcp family effector
MAFQDYGTMYTQVGLILASFIEKAKAGGSTEDSYLKLDDVKGEATDSTHKDQIPVYFAQNFIVTTGGAVGTGSGKATPSDYFLVIPCDKSNPPLEQAVASGKPYQKAEIFYRRAEKGEQKEYQTDTLEDVRVSLYFLTHTPVTSHPHVAIIALQYAKATWAHGSTKAGRDFAANKNS